MPFSERRLSARAPSIVLISCCAALLAACGSQPTQQTAKQRSSEYFAESEWGVSASPRVSNLESGLRRGGGRDHTGRPYQIRGQWYHPAEDPDYRKTGRASWYGSAFHGRLTANGEVYDMHHLTAAHPTMPLPSYARVTNLENGTSLVVRVNDRGPFVNGRIIDLSQRSAELLGTKGSGVGRVEVEYLGRAPLHGQDDEFLLASYRPAGRGPESDGLPTGVMMAMNGSTPTAAVSSNPFDARRPSVSVGTTGSIIPVSATGSADSFPTMPQHGPIPARRPELMASAPAGAAMALSYADHRIAAATSVLEGLAADEMTETAAVEAWERRNREVASTSAPEAGMYVSAGTFASEPEAWTIAGALDGLGEVEIVPGSGGMASVVVRPDGRTAIDMILEAAWAAGASDAMTVRD